MRDFFVSYTQQDSEWATWIAWVLEEAGYETLIQAWDIRGNFLLQMDRAMRETKRTISVLSPAYLESDYAPVEWAATLQRDPRSEKDLLVVFRIAVCEPEGWLGQIAYTDLVGLSESAARDVILRRVDSARSKPATAPRFPQTAFVRNVPRHPPYPAAKEDSVRFDRIRAIAREWRANWASRANELSEAIQHARDLQKQSPVIAGQAPRRLIELAAETADDLSSLPLSELEFATHYGLYLHRTVISGLAQSEIRTALNSTAPETLRAMEKYQELRGGTPPQLDEYVWESIVRVLDSARSLAKFSISQLPQGYVEVGEFPAVSLDNGRPLLLMQLNRSTGLDLVAPLSGTESIGRIAARSLDLDLLAAQVDKSGALVALAQDAQHLYLWQGGQTQPIQQLDKKEIWFKAGGILSDGTDTIAVAVGDPCTVMLINATGLIQRIVPNQQPRQLGAAAVWVNCDESRQWSVLLAGRAGELIRMLPDGSTDLRSVWDEPLFAGPANGPGPGWSSLVDISLGILDGFSCALIYRRSFWGLACVFVDPGTLSTLRAPMLLDGAASFPIGLTVAGRWLLVGCTQRGGEPGPRLLAYDLDAGKPEPQVLLEAHGDMHQPIVTKHDAHGFQSLQLLNRFARASTETERALILSEGPNSVARELPGFDAIRIWPVAR